MTEREARSEARLIGAATFLGLFIPLALLGLWGAELGMNRRDLPLATVLTVCAIWAGISFFPARAAYRKALSQRTPD
jgi:hypothetical protein